MACTTARTVQTKQQPCRRECMLLGKRANNGMSISFSHIRNHKVQQVNLQWKRVFWPEGNCMVRLRLSTKAIKTLKTKVMVLDHVDSVTAHQQPNSTLIFLNTRIVVRWVGLYEVC
jgi:large subunit ribosomal protein L28